MLRFLFDTHLRQHDSISKNVHRHSFCRYVIREMADDGTSVHQKPFFKYKIENRKNDG